MDAILAFLGDFNLHRTLQQVQPALFQIHKDGTGLVEFCLAHTPLGDINDINLQGLDGTGGHSGGLDNLHLILEAVGIGNQAQLVQRQFL